ncbi:F-box/kelch-repeat protein like [Capsicum chacoense]
MSLPEDILIEVFEKLPMKSCTRFRSVNSEWDDTLHSLEPSSCIMRSRCLETLRHIYSLYTRGEEELVAGTFYKVGMRIATVMKGIVCICNGDSIALWNPANEQTLELPRHHRSEFMATSIGLAWINNQIVVIKIYLGDVVDDVVMFSLQESRWISLGNDTKIGIENEDGACDTIVYGTPYWIGETRRDSCIKFDVETNMFEEIRLPRTIQREEIEGEENETEEKERKKRERNDFTISLYGLRGKLAILVRDKQPMPPYTLTCHSWILDDDGHWMIGRNMVFTLAISRFINPLENGDLVVVTEDQSLTIIDRSTSLVKATVNQGSTHVQKCYEYKESDIILNEPWTSKLKRRLLLFGVGLVGGIVVSLYMKKRQGNGSKRQGNI